MTVDEKMKCEEWVKAHRTSWQTLNRSQWKYQFRGKAMVRFVEEMTMREEEVKLLLEYLSSDDCIATLSLYDQSVSSEWKPIRAWYEISNKSHGNIHAVRLYHGLQTDPEETDGGTYIVEDGCAYKVEIRYVWNAARVETVRAGTSGVSYRIEGISRDPDTGLFSYAVEKRERVQQDIEEYLTATTIFADAKEEVHLGVKGAMSAGGKAASVGNGRRVTRNVSKNADCTHDVHNKTEIDKAVADAEVEWHKGLHGVRKTKTDRNQASPLNGDGMVVGETRRTKKTDTGLNDNTVSTQTTEAAGVVARGASKTAFDDTESERENVAAGGVLPEVEVAESGNGIVHSADVSLNEDGTADVTRRTRTEKPVKDAVVEYHKTLRGTRKTVTDRSQADAVDGRNMKVGETRTTRKTEGGRNDNTVSTQTAEAAGDIAAQERDTAFEHSRQTTKNIAAETMPESSVATAGDGKIRTKSVRRNDDGATADVIEGETQEKAVRDAEVEKRMTLHGLTVRKRHRSQEGVPEDPAKVGEGVSYRLTDGGRYDIVETKEGASPAGKISEGCTQDNFSHRHTTTRNEAAVQDVETVFTPGRIVRKSGAKTANGTASNTTEVVTAKAMKHRYQYEREDGSVVHVIQYRNQPSENVGYPNGAYALTVHDSVNSFGLHDGTATWMTNVPGRGASMADYKFMRSGARVDIYEVKWETRKRWMRHRKWTVQLNHVRGSPYIGYLDMEEEANPSRIDSGVLAVRLVNGPYMDSIGTVCAEWKYAVLYTSSGWEVCTSQCTHGDESQDLAAAISKILDIGGFNTRALGGDANEGMKELAQALKELPIALTAARTLMSPDETRTQIDQAIADRKGGGDV